VVVTAQRRQQNLQDVPVSVTAAGAAALTAAHVDDVSNIKALSPGVSFTTNYNPAVTSNIQVRGVGTVGTSRTFEGAVGVFVDGVYRTHAGQAFLDVDSLQILSEFSIHGISVVDVGATNFTAAGNVYHLTKLSDFSGNYVAAGAGVTLAGGGTAVYLKNEHGVVIKLVATDVGLKFNLSADGVHVNLKS
jgi:hypothetical protein